MKRLIMIVFLVFSSQMVLAASLTEQQVHTLLVGKTVSGGGGGSRLRYEAYVYPDGKLRVINEQGVRFDWRWRTEKDGRFCTALVKEKETCTRITAGKNGAYMRVREDGSVQDTFTKIVKGNPRKL